jgi:hypothetical protein
MWLVALLEEVHHISSECILCNYLYKMEPIFLVHILFCLFLVCILKISYNFPFDGMYIYSDHFQIVVNIWPFDFKNFIIGGSGTEHFLFNT